MFMMVNTLNKRQKQYNQELKEIETKKSDKEVQFVHPHTKAQRGEILDDLIFSLCLQKYGHYISTRLTTLNMPRPYSK